MAIAGWSSPVARQVHTLKVVGSNPTPVTKFRYFRIKLYVSGRLVAIEAYTPRTKCR
jgi:hypothetical protein